MLSKQLCSAWIAKGFGQSIVQHRSVNSAGGSGHSNNEEAGLFPARVTRKGNYGYEIEQADGKKVI